jgi:hypothetical protein
MRGRRLISNTYVHVTITDQGAAGTLRLRSGLAAALQKLGEYLLTLREGATHLAFDEE